MSCFSLATTFAVSLQEFQSFLSFHFLWCQTSALHWIAAAPFDHAFGRGLFSFVSHVCLSFKNGGQGSNIGFSPPLGLHEDSQPLAASPWLDNSVIENTLKKKGWQGRRIW